MIRKVIEKYNGLSKGTKASLWFSVCSIFQKGIAFIATPFYTRLLTTYQYGTFSVYNSWLSIITIFATLNLSMGVMNNAITKCDRFKTDDKGILSSFQILELFTITIVSLIFIGIYFLFPNVYNISFKMMMMMIANIFFTSAVSLWTTKEKFNYNFKPVVIVSIISTLLTFAINLTLIAVVNDKSLSLIYGTVISAAICYFPLMIHNIKSGRHYVDMKLWKYALMFNFPLIPHYLSMIILSSSDRIMIENMQSIDAAALYTIPYSIASLSMIFINAINASLVPETYQRLKDKNYGGFANKVDFVLFVFITIIVFIMLMGPEVVWIMGGDEYIEAKWVIPPVAASMYFMLLYPLFANVEFYYERRRLTMIASIIAAISNIFLNYVLIPVFGYVAAAFTTLICYTILAFAHYIAFWKIRKEKSIDHFYREDRIFFMSVGVLVLVGVSYILYFIDIARYIVCFILFIIVVLNYKRILHIFGLDSLMGHR